MELLPTEVRFGFLGLLLTAVVLVELKSGKVGLKVGDNKLVSRADHPLVFWGSVVITALGAAMYLILSLTGGADQSESVEGRVEGPAPEETKLGAA